MKKIFIILTCLLVAGCMQGPTPTPIARKNEPTTDVFNEIIKFDFEGHKYIWFRSLNGGYAGWDGGIVHDPDCDCMIDYD